MERGRARKLRGGDVVRIQHDFLAPAPDPSILV
jgi:hypothetical protein